MGLRINASDQDFKVCSGPTAKLAAMNISSLTSGGLTPSRKTATSDISGAITDSVTLQAQSKTAEIPASWRLRQNTLSGYDRSNMDLSVDPKVDFYHYAVGSYLKNHPIPESESVWGIDAELGMRVKQSLKESLEAAAAAPRNNDEKRLGDFYASGMDTQAREKAGLGPLGGILQNIDQVEDLKGLQQSIGQLQSVGINPLFEFGSGQDARDASKVTAQAFQGGLGLGERDYYLKNDDDSIHLRDKYRQHVSRSFQLLGQDEATAARSADAVMRIETRLAENSLTVVELRDPEATYNPMNRQQLHELSPNFDWGGYLKEMGRPDIDTVNVATPKFFTGLNAALTEMPLDDWKTYVKWTATRSLESSLSKDFVAEDFAFRKEMTGAKEPAPQWKTMVETTDNYLGDGLGKLFVEKNFPPEAKAKAEEIVHNVIGALRDRIPELDWMGPETKAKAIEKVDKMRFKIGYPDKWKDYGDLAFDRSDYAGNVLAARKAQVTEDMGRIGQPVDKNRWLMTPSTVNAYYDPPNNEFVITAGILQPPYFDLKQDDALNYAITGGTIGHEITHGFDDQGALYDADGNLANWWTEQDKKNFDALTGGVAKQFSEFSYEGIPVNGKLVEGESVADLGGLEIALRAYHKSREGKVELPSPDGFTNDQRFFLGFADSWAWNIRPERAKNMVLTNEHPLPEFRAQAPLQNMPAFLEAFSVPPGSPMYRPLENRNHIWG